MISWKLRLRWQWYALKRWWYKTRWGINMEPFSGSMLPDFGKGKFVSVYKKGGIIDVVGEYKDYAGHMIRLIPYQPNHGLMIEVWVDGHMRCRHHCDINMLAAAAGINWYPGGGKLDGLHPEPMGLKKVWVNREETAAVG